MARHRIHSIEFKRQVVQEYVAGETLHGLARHDLSRNLIRIWVEKYEAALRRGRGGGRPAAGVRGADRRARAAGRQAGAGDGVPKRGSAERTIAEKRAYIRDHRPRGLSVAEGCRLMGIARSTYYGAPACRSTTPRSSRMEAICDEFEAYGYRRVKPRCATGHGREPQEGQTSDA